LLVDILLIILALGLAAALFMLRRKPTGSTAGGTAQPRGSLPTAPESRPAGGRLAAALATTSHWFPAGPASGASLPPSTGPVPGAPLTSTGGPAPAQVREAPAQGGHAATPFYFAPRPQETPTAMLFPGAYLEVLTGEEAGNRLPLAPGDNRVGRGPGNHLRLADRTVSNQHAIIRVTPGQVLLFDDSSTNGTFVNGQRVLQPRPLAPGDRITVGQTVLQFHLESAAQAPERAG